MIAREEAGLASGELPSGGAVAGSGVPAGASVGQSDGGFPTRAWDPFRWAWDGAAGNVTVGNLMLYTAAGALLTLADQEVAVADEETAYVYMQHNHGTNALTVGKAASEESAQTTEEDIGNGVQKFPLYKFTRSGAALACVRDYIHHGAVSGNMR